MEKSSKGVHWLNNEKQDKTMPNQETLPNQKNTQGKNQVFIITMHQQSAILDHVSDNIFLLKKIVFVG